MTNRSAHLLATAAILLAASSVAAQTTTPGAAIDVEIYNPADGGNTFCVAPGDTFWASLYVRPASGAGSTMTCTPLCGSAVGGPGSLAAAAVDVGFAPGTVAYLRTDVNPDASFAAVDGLVVEQNLGDGRIGWALAGDWTPDGTTTGALGDPCEMRKLDRPDWVVRLGFSMLGAGTTSLEVNVPPEGPLSFADVCGSPAYTTANGGVDEVVAATVTNDCPATSRIIFRNGVETGDSSVWTSTIG